MNVLIVAAKGYPDRVEILARMKKGADTEHKTWRRKGDLEVKKLATEAGLEFEEFISAYGFDSEAYENELMNAMDFIIVYATAKSSVTEFYVKKATVLPYSLIFGHKVEINEKKLKGAKK